MWKLNQFQQQVLSSFFILILSHTVPLNLLQLLSIQHATHNVFLYVELMYYLYKFETYNIECNAFGTCLLHTGNHVYYSYLALWQSMLECHGLYNEIKDTCFIVSHTYNITMWMRSSRVVVEI